VLTVGSVSGAATEVLAESLDTNLLSHVELVADGSGAGEKPVVVIRGELLEASSLNYLGPLLNIKELELTKELDKKRTRCIGLNARILLGGKLTSGILNLLSFFRC
jgi:hypothetical protein